MSAALFGLVSFCCLLLRARLSGRYQSRPRGASVRAHDASGDAHDGRCAAGYRRFLLMLL